MRKTVVNVAREVIIRGACLAAGVVLVAVMTTAPWWVGDSNRKP